MAGLRRVIVPDGIQLNVVDDRRALLAAIDPTPALRRIYRSARAYCEGALHPRRHRALLLRIAKGQRPRRILVVCHGNVCRSPYLQAVLQRNLPDVSVTSAGFVGPDRPVPQNSLVIGRQRGFDLSRFRSQLLTETLADADIVVVMNSDQAREIGRKFAIERRRIVVAGDLDPAFHGGRAIPDPWNQSIEVFNDCFDRLDRCGAALVEMLRRPQSSRS